MNKSENISELSAALAKAQTDIKHAIKASENPFFKSNYADLPSVMDAAKPALSANGISVIQSPEQTDKGWIMKTMLLHTSGQWVEGDYPINPSKQDPQGFGSAVTYARRYAYCAMCGVSAVGEDDDGNAASGKNGQQQTRDPHTLSDEEKFALRFEESLDARKWSNADKTTIRRMLCTKYKIKTVIDIPAEAREATLETLKTLDLEGWKKSQAEKKKSEKQAA